jgi:5-formyltetrahydrofolate cyclo-ligase
MFLEKRKTLTIDEHAKRSTIIGQNILHFIKEKNLRTIHLFLPIERQREVEINGIIDIIKNSREHKLVVPAVDPLTNELNHYRYDNKTALAKGKFGITEPKNAQQIAISEIDCVFIPLISFDRIGNRIGYGGGYYDKFLARVPKKCLKIGLSLSPPLDLIPYAEAHDVIMDYCINHHTTYSFK